MIDGVWKKLALLLTLVAFVVYANTLVNDFALDDYLVIKDNAFVAKGLGGIFDILTTPYHKGFNSAATELYRPLSLVVFAIVHQFFGAAPAVYHLVNVLVYAGCVVAFFLFLSRLFRRRRVVMPFVAALLFALHPIHTEVVANCKSLDELLCFLFCFSAMNMLLAYTERGRAVQLAGSAVLYLLAFLAKETAVTMLAIIPFVLLVYRNEDKKRTMTAIAAIVVMAGLALAMRYMVLSPYSTAATDISFIDNPLAGKHIPAATRMATAILILGKYLKLLLLPYPLICDYSYNSIPFADFGNIWVLLSLVTYMVLAVVCVLRLRRSRTDMYGFGILFYMVTLSLFTNILFLIGDNMAERFLFFPSVGICIVAALLVERLAQRDDMSALYRPRVLAILLPVCLAYAGIAVARNAEWKNNTTLYTADVQKAPEDSRLNFFVGNELSQTGDLRGGIAYMQKAVEIYPEYAAAHLELGRAAYDAKMPDVAEVHARKALELLPGNVTAANSLGATYLAKGRYDEAITIYEGVIRREPGNVLAHFNLGASYANKQQYAQALAALRATVMLDPAYGNYTPYEYMVRIYQKMGMPDSATVYEGVLRRVGRR
ncbi:tetratricopeptide repeat protein [Nemorincola caseinilytica]|uniref:Tetratricopeptide repeat protein n=2 Tax=Nemorincola caseinilytica TaxID=2054315 RepID=A0ABP8NEI4_9BACT